MTTTATTTHYGMRGYLPTGERIALGTNMTDLAYVEECVAEQLTTVRRGCYYDIFAYEVDATGRRVGDETIIARRGNVQREAAR